MNPQAILILNQAQIEQKINRLAWQIYEQNFDAEHLLICGIMERGFALAQKIAVVVEEISGIPTQTSKVVMDKVHPKTNEITLEPAINNPENKCVILCDDVLYTGKTLAYAAIPFLEANVKKLQCLVLIQRNYLSFPIQPNFVGLPIATTLQEHIEVDFNKNEVWMQ